jgi:hypothetical protein
MLKIINSIIKAYNAFAWRTIRLLVYIINISDFTNYFRLLQS